jgi:hypothetical protein
MTVKTIIGPIAGVCLVAGLCFAQPTTATNFPEAPEIPSDVPPMRLAVSGLPVAKTITEATDVEVAVLPKPPVNLKGNAPIEEVSGPGPSDLSDISLLPTEPGVSSIAKNP